VNRPTSPRELEVLLIDGNNLLHRTHGGVDAGAQRTLAVQLSAALPGVRKIVVFDGHRATHETQLRLPDASLEIRYAGGTADDELVAQVMAIDFETRGRTVLVSDDRALTERARSAGARTQRLGWLVQLLGEVSGRAPGHPAGSIGQAGPRPARAAGPQDEGEGDERPPWQPGRGATRKTGNPRRNPRRRGRSPRR
jgi:hypothetical protein